MALLEPLYRISEICSQQGLEHVIVCPGSRSAALTLAFNRNAHIKTHVIVDERSAAFVALGMAQTSGKPVGLICTSGTAALNFSSAVAEAFFQKIPLLVLTADRPPEWINQHDGQTIFQKNVFGNHIIKSYDFPVDYTHPDSIWQIERQTQEALALTKTGPVHINIPIREPFYPETEEKYSGTARKLNYSFSDSVLSQNEWTRLLKKWNSADNIIIAVGQNHTPIDEALAILSQDSRVSVWVDVISNVNIENKVSTQDTFLPKLNETPEIDLLITTGQSFISKPLKQFFRKNKPSEHWHVDESVELIDPLQSVTDKILVSSEYFLTQLSEKVKSNNSNEVFWSNLNNLSTNYLSRFLENAPYGELKATKNILDNINSREILHVGNSMPVRYANVLAAFLTKGVKVYANRGTSGIDGIVSTALGQALVSNETVHCIVGDVSFFYDSNALFASKPANLKVYLMNNGGGNIFRIIEGPRNQEELESHFITNPNRSAKNLSEEAGFKYVPIHNEADLDLALKNKEDVATLFEIFLDGVKDSEIFRNLKAGFTL